MKIIRPNDTSDYLDIIHNYKYQLQTILGIGVTKRLTIYYTDKQDINVDKCTEYEALIIPYTSNGGSAISNIGDLSIYFGIKGKHTGWCVYVFESLRKWLLKKGLKVDIGNNDLIIYNKKFAGYTEHPDLVYSSGSIFIAMTNSTDLIKQICLKPKTKGATGLTDYGFTVTEISEVIIDATKKYLKFIGVE